MRLLMLMLLFIASIPARAALSPESSRVLYERIKELAGDWEGKSTKGWTDTNHIEVIAGGSAVMFTSFDAHPNERMATMVHLDGDRLLLTHYCMAKNQPRLVATSFDPETGEAVFEFLDGTGMASRDTGHMDKMKLQLKDKNGFRERWTWYAKGQERWLEDIEYRRER
jgi:hypothetical protein